MSEGAGKKDALRSTRGWIVFIGLQAVVWAILIGLALEVYTVLSWRRIEAQNPYVRARHGEVTWPDSDNMPPEEPPVIASTPPEAWLPQPSPLDMWQWRMDYFLTLDQRDRATFARVYEQNIYLVDREGVISEAYLHPPVDALPPSVADHSGPAIEAFAQAILAGEVSLPARRVFEDGAHTAHALPLETPADGFALFLDGFYPLPEGMGEDSIYEVPWFSYRKHATLPRRHFSPEDLGAEQFSTNNFGFRDRDVVVPRPAHVFRIVCVGASTTEEGMNNAYTYPNLLEAELNAHFDTPEFDVINAGIAGLNISKERMRLADYLALDPHLLIIYNGVNDIAHFHFQSWINEAAPWQRLLRRSKFITYHFNALFRPSDAAIREALKEQTIAQLLQMRARAADSGVTVVLTTFARPDIAHLPRVQRDYFDLYAYDLYNSGSEEGRLITFAAYCHTMDLFNDALRDVCREADIPLIDIAAEVTGGTEIFGDVCHMRNRGIEAKARAVFEQLTGPLAGLLPPDARPTGTGSGD